MSDEALREVSQLLTIAEESMLDSDAEDRLDELADQFERIADGEQGPDHGRMVRLQRAIDDLQDTAGNQAQMALIAKRAIEDADEELKLYREEMDGEV